MYNGRFPIEIRVGPLNFMTMTSSPPCKRTCFFIAIATFLVFEGMAQENSDFKTETIEFLKLTGATKAFENGIAQLGAGVPQANKSAYLEEASATLDDIYGKVADLYMQEFTQDEIGELIGFYSSDLGKKVADKQLGLSQQIMQIGQSWGMNVQQIAQKYSQ